MLCIFFFMVAEHNVLGKWNYSKQAIGNVMGRRRGGEAGYGPLLKSQSLLSLGL